MLHMREVEAVLLAGGKGVRMGDVSIERQKCLLPIENRPVLYYIMEALVRAFGSVDLKIAVCHKADQVIDFINKNKPKTITPTYVYDNGQGNWAAYYGMKDHVRGKFVGLAGDVITIANVYQDIMLDAETPDSAMTFSLSPYHIADTHSLIRLENGKISELTFPVKRSDEVKPGQLRDMAIYSCDERFFKILELYPSPRGDIMDSVKQALVDGRELGGRITNEPWLHVAYPKDLHKAWNYE